MVVTELGMVTCCRLVQSLNRALEIVVSELGRTIEVNPVQLSNAE